MRKEAWRRQIEMHGDGREGGGAGRSIDFDCKDDDDAGDSDDVGGDDWSS